MPAGPTVFGGAAGISAGFTGSGAGADGSGAGVDAAGGGAVSFAGWLPPPQLTTNTRDTTHAIRALFGMLGSINGSGWRLMRAATTNAELESGTWNRQLLHQGEQFDLEYERGVGRNRAVAGTRGSVSQL